MTASAATSLYDLAAELLAKSVAILAATASGAPRSQYVSQGAPAYDCCDTITVHAGTIQYGSFRRGATGSVNIDPKMHVVPLVPLTVTALRCAKANPQGGIAITLPTPALLAADAAMIYTDGWSLFCGINNAYRDESLFAGYPCRPFEVDGALPISPEGGCLGWAITVHVELQGFDPPGMG